MSNNKILLVILVKDKEVILNDYLSCIYNLDYDKKDIFLYIKTNDNNDNSENILINFINNYKNEYYKIFFDNLPINEELKKYKPHEWNSFRFKILGKIRDDSIKFAYENKLNYFVVDADNLISPFTLKNLINSNVEVIAPMLNSNTIYSNFHENSNDKNYMNKNSEYMKILNKKKIGIIEVDLIHCTYLIKYSALEKMLNNKENKLYDDDSGDYEFKIFNNSLKKYNIKRYIDNRYFYGIIPDWTEIKQKEIEIKENIYYGKFYLKYL